MILAVFKLKIILVLFCAAVTCDSSFPSTLPRCKYADVKCLKNVITTVIQSSSAGIPEIGLGSIDPLFIGKAIVEQGAASSPINIKIRMKNATMIGASQFVIKQVVGFDKDPKNSKFEIHGSCPRVTILGNYQINGKVLVLPVSGHGLANISLYDMDINMEFITHTEIRNDAEYLVIDKLLYESNAKRMFMNFDNLFNDAVISENMNNFFNQNQDILYNEMRYSTNSLFANIMKKRIQDVFNKFPYRELFLD